MGRSCESIVHNSRDTLCKRAREGTRESENRAFPYNFPQRTSSLTGHSWKYFINTRPVSWKIRPVCSSVRLLLPINAQHRHSVRNRAKTLGERSLIRRKIRGSARERGKKKRGKKLQQRAWMRVDFSVGRIFFRDECLFLFFLLFRKLRNDGRRHGFCVIWLEHCQPSLCHPEDRRGFLDASGNSTPVFRACTRAFREMRQRFSPTEYLRCFQVGLRESSWTWNWSRVFAE